MRYKVNVSIERSAFPYRIIVEACLEHKSSMPGNKEECYQRVVPNNDDFVLLEAVRQALDGRVLSGQWDMVEGDE